MPTAQVKFKFNLLTVQTIKLVALFLFYECEFYFNEATTGTKTLL